MISPYKALEIILKQTKQLPSENINANLLLGRVLAEDISAKSDMPPFNKSAMDGFAARSKDLNNIPRKLQIIELIKAGDIPRKRMQKGQCSKIMTGAQIPAGADSVVMVENTDQRGDEVRILKSVKKNENICFKGENFKRGSILLRKGQVIGMAELAVLVSQSVTKIKVIRNPRVFILSTGDEIVSPGKKVPLGKIRDSNGPMLLAKCRQLGFEATYLGIAQDTVSSLSKKIKKALGGNILIVSGAVSVSEFDLVPRVLKKFNIRPVFHKITMKPGNPLLFSRRGNFLVFGLPGNPVSSLLGFSLFIQYALRKMAGEKRLSWKTAEARLADDFHKKRGKTSFFPCQILKRGKERYIRPISYAGSGDIYAITRADAFVIVEKNKAFAPKSSMCKFIRI